MEAENDNGFSRLEWGLYPQFRQQLFDPNNPFAVQFLAAGYVSFRNYSEASR